MEKELKQKEEESKSEGDKKEELNTIVKQEEQTQKEIKELEDSQIEYKQQVIQKEIIDKNYDKHLFYTFCMKKKENGDDFAKWSIKELSDVVIEFTESQNDKDKLYEHMRKKQSEEIQINIGKLKDHKMLFASLNSSSYTKEITCNKIPKSLLNDISPEVTIKDPKLSTGNTLSFNYITFEVQTSLVKWSVRRRYSDFEWLRTILVNQYPKLYIPPVPDKQMGAKRFESCFVRKRMKFLQSFIDILIDNELFKASEVLIVFLSEEDRTVFDRKMTEQYAVIPPKEIENMSNLTGIVITTIDNEENQLYQSNIERYFNKKEIVLEKLNSDLNNFYHNISLAEQNLSYIQKDFEALHLLNWKASMKEEIILSYEELSSFIKNWKRILHNQNEIFASNLGDFFEYMRMESTAYKDLIKRRKALKDLYILEKTKLTNKKETQWATMDTTQWDIEEKSKATIDQSLLCKDKRYAFELMNTNETKMVENLYVQLCNANRSIIDELKKIIDRYCISYIDAIKRFSNEMYPSLNDALSVWTDLATFVDDFSHY